MALGRRVAAVEPDLAGRHAFFGRLLGIASRRGGREATLTLSAPRRPKGAYDLRRFRLEIPAAKWHRGPERSPERQNAMLRSHVAVLGPGGRRTAGGSALHGLPGDRGHQENHLGALSDRRFGAFGLFRASRMAVYNLEWLYRSSVRWYSTCFCCENRLELRRTSTS